MPFLIDGHNLIPKLPGLSLKAIDDEEQLIKRLQSFCRTTRKRVEVFFDNAPAGYAGTRKFGSVIAHFVRQGTTADAAIRFRLEKLGREARNWTVVSSDREVIATARAAHARTQSSEDFATTLHHLETNTAEHDPESIRSDITLSQQEVEEWFRIFEEGGGSPPEHRGA